MPYTLPNQKRKFYAVLSLGLIGSHLLSLFANCLQLCKSANTEFVIDDDARPAQHRPLHYPAAEPRQWLFSHGQVRKQGCFCMDKTGDQPQVMTAIAHFQENYDFRFSRITQHLCWCNHHRDRVDRVCRFAGAAADRSSIPGWRGMSPPLLQSSSYQTTIATQAFANMDFETASRLSRLYAFQDLYYRLVDRLMTAALNGRLSELGRIRSSFNELYSLGSELVGVYQQTLSAMATRGPTPSSD